jgi:excisionase family DNA binding protein
MNKKDDDDIRISEVATILDVSEKTVYRMAGKSEIPAYKIGGSWRFKRSEITAWKEQQRNKKN